MKCDESIGQYIRIVSSLKWTKHQNLPSSLLTFQFIQVISGKMLTKQLLILLGMALVAKGLEHYEKYYEGPCKQPESAKNISLQAFDEMKFITGANRGQYLRMASNHPDYESLTEDQLQDSLCLKCNTTVMGESSIAAVFGFGRRLLTYDVFPTIGGEGQLRVRGTPRDGFEHMGNIRQTITLTDNKNYALAWICWENNQQMSWSLVTRTRNVDDETRRIAVEHVTSLGFKPENFVFLRNGKCDSEN